MADTAPDKLADTRPDTAPDKLADTRPDTATDALTIGEVSRRSNVAATTLRYYEEIGVLPSPTRVSGSRRYDERVFDRLKIIALCKTAGFSLDEIKVLLKDDAPGRPTSRKLTQAKLAEVDAQMEELDRARRMLEWGLRCTCPSLDACTCGIHPPPDFERLSQ